MEEVKGTEKVLVVGVPKLVYLCIALGHAVSLSSSSQLIFDEDVLELLYEWLLFTQHCLYA